MKTARTYLQALSAFLLALLLAACAPPSSYDSLQLPAAWPVDAEGDEDTVRLQASFCLDQAKLVAEKGRRYRIWDKFLSITGVSFAGAAAAAITLNDEMTEGGNWNPRLRRGGLLGASIGGALLTVHALINWEEQARRHELLAAQLQYTAIEHFRVGIKNDDDETFYDDCTVYIEKFSARRNAKNTANTFNQALSDQMKKLKDLVDPDGSKQRAQNRAEAIEEAEIQLKAKINVKAEADAAKAKADAAKAKAKADSAKVKDG